VYHTQHIIAGELCTGTLYIERFKSIVAWVLHSAAAVCLDCPLTVPQCHGIGRAHVELLVSTHEASASPRCKVYQSVMSVVTRKVCIVLLVPPAGRRWADAALQQPLNPADPSSPTAASVFTLTQPPAQRATKQQINDRLNQHTKHCSICQKALQALQQKMQRAQKAAAALAAACIGVLAGAVLPQIIAAAVAAGAVQPTAAAGVAGWHAGAAAVLAALLGVGAAVAAAVAAAAAKEVEQFVYVEYSHADNH
jgi:hypothetical protein